MQTKLIGLAVIAFLAAALLWQADEKGQLKSEINGYVSTISDMVEYQNNQLKQKEKDDLLLAETNLKHQKTIRDNHELRKQLQQISGCSNDYIDADTIKWVQQYRDQNRVSP